MKKDLILYISYWIPLILGLLFYTINKKILGIILIIISSMMGIDIYKELKKLKREDKK